MKIRFIALIVALIFAFTACGTSGAVDTSSQDGTENTPAGTENQEENASGDENATESTEPAESGTTETSSNEVAEFEGFPPREQTLIVEPDGDVHPMTGNFNSYMIGAPSSWGGHQIQWGRGLWDVNTMTGETIPTIAEGMAEPNEDFTEWTVKLREGLTWTDGELLTAEDVAFTLEMIMTNEGLVDYTLYNSIFSGSEVVDDTTIIIRTVEPFPRLMTQLGVNMHGTGFNIVPEHIWRDVDPTSFENFPPVTIDAYKYVAHDPLGTWLLYEKREDWINTPTGRAWGEPGPPYILYKMFGTSEARVMAMINNEVDVMNEVSIEEFHVMESQNPNVRGWYPDFPWASIDDACSKGIMFNLGVEPFDNPDVRWALTLIPDHIEVTMNIFEGVGRMSPFAIPSISIQTENYLKEFSEWMETDFKITGDYNPWNPNFTQEVAEAVSAEFGHDFSGMSQEQLEDIFGIGYWKTDHEKATSLLEGAGFTNQDGTWYKPDGTPWVIDVLLHPEEGSMHAHRSARVISDQWARFGIGTNVTVLHGADIGVRVDMGDFQTVSAWPMCSRYGLDSYQNIHGWNSIVFNWPIGEKATGISSHRLAQADPELSAKISDVIEQLSVLGPDSTQEIHDLHIEFLKLATEANLGIQVHAGIKMVPINETYWTGFPTSEDPYEGPWWWWSLFRGITTHVKPVS